jgi:ABC-2 type transport system ATP-binding protein
MDSIDAQQLSKTFGRNQAVISLNLVVAAGEIFGLVGPDGAGKTTTLRLLCRALEPDKGAVIKIAGIDLLQQTEQARSKIGYLPQRFSLYEDLTVIENIRFFAEVRGLKPSEWRSRSMDILAFVGLAAFSRRRAGQLSGGMKQKLGLAAALVHQPQVLLLDEPTTGVDPVTRQDFWQLIIRLAGSGTAILISTPYMDEATRCTRVGFMRSGRLVTVGTPAELRKPLEGQILELLGQPLTLLRTLIRDVPGVRDVQMFGDRLHIRVEPGQLEPVRNQLEKWLPSQGCEFINIRPIQPILEDVFISLLEETL